MRLETTRRRRRGATRFVPAVSGLEIRALLSTLTVTNRNDSGPGSLRNAISTASSGDTINFAPSAYGTINVSSTNGPLTIANINLTIIGPGAGLETISGGGSTGDFLIEAPFPPSGPPNSVNISGLTIANGSPNLSGPPNGGGILDFGTTLTVSHCVFSGDQAPTGFGGAIDAESAPILNLDHDLFSGNTAGSATSAGFSLGGAIFCTGTTTITSSTFQNNQALGTNAQGGAIQTSFSSSLTISNSSFTNNLASGSNYGIGGAIMGDDGATLTLSSSQFTNNKAMGPGFAAASEGGAILMNAGSDNFGNPIQTTITNSVFSGNQAVQTPGPFGGGAGAQGGAIAVQGGVFTMTGTTVSNNQAVGASSTTSFGGSALGGGVFAVATQVNFASDAFLNNVAQGGSGPQGLGFVVGGAINSFFGLFGPSGPETSTITNSLFVGNQAINGTGPGGFGLTAGGALDNLDSSFAITGTSFLGNAVNGGQGTNGGAGCTVFGGAIDNSNADLSIQGGVISGNSALGGRGGDNSSGAGGAGGDANGGGVSSQGGTLTITGTLILGNQAIGGRGGSGTTTGGNGGNGIGGGIESDTGTLIVMGAVITLNLAEGGDGGPGASDGQGLGGGVAVVSGTGTLTKTKVFLNHASTSGDNVYGPVTIS
jgi:hypothetical protein